MGVSEELKKMVFNLSFKNMVLLGLGVLIVLNLIPYLFKGIPSFFSDLNSLYELVGRFLFLMVFAWLIWVIIKQSIWKK